MTPGSIQQAVDQGKARFWGPDGNEWELRIDDTALSIEQAVGAPVLVFANNGYGDHLFLKKGAGDTFGEEVFAYYHEGPEIVALDEHLEFLLELKEHTPASDNYPAAVYETGQQVALGDRVRFRHGLFFWKGWMDGVVRYVPGLSPRSSQHEYNGLKWVSIHGEGMIVGALVDPKTGVLRKIRFVERSREARQKNT